MTFAGWVATIAGWYVTEIGRQPFIVAGLIRTSDVASRVPSSSIALTLAIYIVLYLLLLVAYVGVLKYMSETADKIARPLMTEGRRQRARRNISTGENSHDFDVVRRTAPADLHRR